MDTILWKCTGTNNSVNDIIGGDNIIRVGFIGAGKCGMSLAYYFRSKGIEIVGFSSKHTKTEKDFRILTDEDLINNSDIIFITVTDTDIHSVWNRINEYDLTQKIICHCSGSLSSDIFEGANQDMICSVHPMLAFNSKHTSEEDVSKAYFTLEGGNTAVETIKQILSKCSNQFKTIKKEDKVLYHAAACFASNFVVSVCEKAEQMLCQCGFDHDTAHKALIPLMSANMDHIISDGTKNAVTGPASRGDMLTIKKHLECLDDKTKTLYQYLTQIIFDMKA